jgi:hypothetical protein
MKISSFTLLIFWLSIITAIAQENRLPDSDLYGTGNWDADSLGNHRVVLRVKKSADIVWAHIPWRRRDLNPEKKEILIVDVKSGQIIDNVFPASINREFGDILFQPVTVPGEYYIYYLKYFVKGRSNYPTVRYPPFVSRAEGQWLIKAKSSTENMTNLLKAELVQFQSVDQFNSFYPMEIIATREEVDKIIQKNPGSEYLLFPENRENSIKMTTDIPFKWINNGITNSFSGKALKGEYFTFQVGVYAARSNIENIEVEFSGLNKEGKPGIDAGAFTSFNTGGIDWEGKPFKKECRVDKGKVQALWIGVQVPQNIDAGLYEGTLKVKPLNMSPTDIKVKFEVLNEQIGNSGDNEPTRLSRLRWLNSTIASDDDVVAPYSPLTVSGNKVKCLGREVTFGQTGFPESIKSYFSESVTKIQDRGREILAAPVRLIVETSEKKESNKNQSFKLIKQEEGVLAWKIENEIPGFKISGKVQMEFDGNIDYQIIFTAKNDISVRDIRLEIPLQPDAAGYMMGLGEKGGFRPSFVDWKWAIEKNQDGPWVGNVNGGLQVRFRDNHYSRPLNTNFYLQKPLYMPDSWSNGNKGGIRISSGENKTVLINSYSGPRLVKKGEQLHYYFNILITPFHTIDTKEHWRNRYFHKFLPVDSVIAYGANTINVHHANEINPFINYPFLRPDKMKAYIDEAHLKGMKVKIYYTVRELSNKAPELFMLRSLGEEVLSYGKGGGFSWLQEHLDSNYIAAWFVPELKDAAVINRGISRWHNFYIEGLQWLVKNIGIDGLYIDDLAFDRTSMMRIRKVLERSNPGALIDLHSANQFNPRDGFANSANLYLENFPYIDRLWFGEYFNYNFPPEFWLIETSGIPFGLMGEMLQGGGNPWRGMVFGMTNRAPWSGNPSPIWKVWDYFGIMDSEMTGYWDSECPVSTDNRSVKATAYVKNDKVLIAIGNWEPIDVEFRLNIDWNKLKINKKSAKLTASSIEGFQTAGEYDFNKPLKVSGGKGLLLVLN